MIRNGKPFYINGSSGDSYLKELKMAGANTIRIYDTLGLRAKMDMADSLQLAVIVDIPMPRFFPPDTIFSNRATMEHLYDATKKFVIAYKDHPALLYWMLGNEVRYPDFPVNRKFLANFNRLLDLVHELDPNHPVSTAVGGFDRSKILSMKIMSPGLDLISINIFGELSRFANRKKNINLLWDGPYVFSEFGINGPWEANKTVWGVPIEETSTKKAEQYRDRYQNFIKSIDDQRLLGALTFYWGFKQEATHTWFSTFLPDGVKTQATFEMINMWRNTREPFKGPEIKYLLINELGAADNIVLDAGVEAKAILQFPDNAPMDTFITSWEIRPENWNYLNYDNEKTPEKLEGLFLQSGTTDLKFKAPKIEGPYRLFVYVSGNDEYIATANIPFYVLKHADVR